MITYKETLITPQMAKELLAGNDHNRRIKAPVVLRYAYDIINGRWVSETGEAIKISVSGKVLDGQHRLHAIIKANKAVSMCIAYGCSDDIFTVLDTGSMRNASDVFKIRDVKNGNNIPSILGTYNQLNANRKGSIQKNYKSTNAMLLAQYELSPEYWQEVSRKSQNWYHSFSRVLSPSQIGGFYAHFSDISNDDADVFIDQLCTGRDLQSNAILLLRVKLTDDKIATRKMGVTLKYALIIKAWNAFRTKQALKILKYDMQRDEYPIAL
jgi:hypothetical protein